MSEPLAIKMAPKSLKDVIGQKHLIGKDKILSNNSYQKYEALKQFFRIGEFGDF